MKHYKNLVVYDWDDTLFPTSWFTRNNLPSTSMSSDLAYYFIRLDATVYKLLSRTIKNCRVLIVTNATMKWFNISSKILTKTFEFIREYVPVISARDTYQYLYPTDIKMWKHLLFNSIIDKYYGTHLYRNIVSVGDNNYELEPVKSRYDGHAFIKNKLLKTVKFIKNPSHQDIMIQLDTVLLNLPKVVGTKEHLDLNFVVKA